MTDLGHLAITGTLIAVHVTPRASQERIVIRDGVIRAYVTAPPDGGKANLAVQSLLAKAMGIARTRLTLVRGATSREKTFRID